MTDSRSGSHLEELARLFNKEFGQRPDHIQPLAGAGSDRKYYRMQAPGISVVGAHNPLPPDYSSFLYLAGHFYAAGLPVPYIMAADEDRGLCLQEDLGDLSLLDYLDQIKPLPDFAEKAFEHYARVIDDLLRFQFQGHHQLDYSRLPVPAFSNASMHWDLNYFKYYFLKPSTINFDEAALQNDFNTLVDFLAEEPFDHFMHRDFQARNIMLHNEKLYYIDFQGGRRGPLHYDLVSLLFQARAALPDELKIKLIGYYLQKAKNFTTLDERAFHKRLHSFALLRLLQVMGAYGFRGWFERKPHFLKSIPMLRPGLQWIFNYRDELPHITEVLSILKEIDQKMENNTLTPASKLAVSINSFSYRRGIPYDASGHGGGYVFDCRLLPNPGRHDEYKQLSGRDHEVITWLENEPAVHSFVESIRQLVSQSVQAYEKEGYTNLQVNFGCTGGRHRSVYCAEQMAAFLRKQLIYNVSLKHQELPAK
jgi:aminoglycoside/choline kinase family phosphotransferase